MEDRSPSPLIKEHRGTLTHLVPGRQVLFPSAVCSPSPALLPSACPPSPALLPSACPPSQEELWHLPGRLCINPSLWDKEDVGCWLHWAQREYSLRRPEKGRFEMNGRALCLLTKEDFRRRCPSSGDVLYELLQCVKQHRRGVVCAPSIPPHLPPPLGHSQPPLGHQIPGSQAARLNGSTVPICSSRIVSECPLTSTSSSPAQHTHTALRGSSREEPLNLSNREAAQRIATSREANGRIPDCRLLWDYVYQLLSDQRYQAFVRWEDQDRLVFRVVEPNGLAQLWGNHKNRANMTYEKMSRALRHYYKLNIIKKEPGQKLLFRFLKTPEEIRGHRADRLDPVDSPEHTPPLDVDSPEHTPPLNADSPEHTPPLDVDSPEHTPTHTRLCDFNVLEVSADSASSSSDIEAL